MKKLLMYPYSPRYDGYIEYWNHKNIIIQSLVCPKGWWNEKIKANIGNKEYSIKFDFEEELSICDVVWFVSDDKIILEEELLFENIAKAINWKKEIIYTRYEPFDQYRKVIQWIPKHQSLMLKKHNANRDFLINKKICYPISCPVVIVFGLEENTQKFEVHLSLWKEFERRGYSVSNISSRKDSELINMHSMPDFMFTKRLDGAEKVVLFNHFVKSIEIKEEPELIIISIPGGVVPFDEFNSNYYGMLAYYISHAVPSDYAIVCIPFYEELDGDFREIANSLYYKFGFNIEYCHMSAIATDITSYFDTHERDFVQVNEKYYKEIISRMKGKNIFNLLDKNVAANVVDNLLKKMV